MKKTIFFIMIVLSNIIYANNMEISKIKTIVSKVSSSIKYGVGQNNLTFNDEIIHFGEGHCGHLSWMLMRELLKEGYDGEIISITTYNKRRHSMVQIERKFDKKKILVDATTNLVYNHSVEEILENPLLSKDTLGESRSPSYSDIAFWSSVNILKYIPYIGSKTLHNIKSISVDDEKIFYGKPNSINASFDDVYSSYTASKMNASKNVRLKIEFEKINRISSFVIEPYDINTYPSKIKVTCINKLKKSVIFDKHVSIHRSMLVLNLYGNDYCNELEFDFSEFVGQNRLLIRDIHIYGK